MANTDDDVTNPTTAGAVEDGDETDVDKQLTEKLKDMASQVWLAGLGAYVKTEKGGGKFFDTLVQEGESLENRTKAVLDRQLTLYKEKLESVRDKVGQVRGKAMDSLEKVEKAFDERVAKALIRLNIPTKQSLSILQDNIEDLQVQVQQLRNELAELRSLSDQSKSVATARARKSKTKTSGKVTS